MPYRSKDPAVLGARARKRPLRRPLSGGNNWRPSITNARNYCAGRSRKRGKRADQELSRPMMASPHHGTCRRERPCRLRNTKLTQVPQLNDQPVFLRKPRQSFVQTRGLFSLFELRVGRAGWVGQAGCGRRVERLKAPDCALSKAVKHFIQGDGAQPGLEARFAAELP